MQANLSVNEKQRLEKVIKVFSLKDVSFISKGFSSLVFKARKGRKKIALKLERDKSRRKEMLEKEVENLMKANSVNIGPKLYFYDKQLKVIGMQLIEGITFNEFIFSNQKEKHLIRVIKLLLLQAKKLDEIKLSHGQLAGKMKNILITKGKPVIIDFEKASMKRKAKNLSQLKAALFFNPYSSIARKIRDIIKEKNLSKLKEFCIYLIPSISLTLFLFKFNS